MKDTHALYTSFAKIFPPLRFLEMPIVGLDISDHSIRFVELMRHGSEFRPVKFGKVKIPFGIVEDGFINDKKKLSEILHGIKKNNNMRFVRASLPEEKSYLFKTEIPVMPEDDIRDALRFKIEENVPVSLDKAVFDYHILRKPKHGDKTMLVSVTVVHIKVVSAYLEVFKNAELTPMSFQIESQAIAHAVVSRGVQDTFILITLRGTRTVLSIVSGREVQFTSTLSIGGEVIATSIKKNLNIDEAEVEKIRQGKEVRDSNEMFLSLVNAATALRDEVQKLVAYWDSHSHEHGFDRAIKGIIISGSDAMLGLDDYLSRSLDIKVALANPWVNILSVDKDVPPLTFRQALDYTAALGLALPYD